MNLTRRQFFKRTAVTAAAAVVAPAVACEALADEPVEYGMVHRIPSMTFTPLPYEGTGLEASLKMMADVRTRAAMVFKLSDVVPESYHSTHDGTQPI